jgi:LysM repeat protein
MKSKRYIIAYLWLILGIILGTTPTAPVGAQSGEEQELINEINALRASHGLAAYTVDPYLMALAHEHSVYQASIHKSTHEHSDGRVPAQIGVVENVAGGDLGFITPQTVLTHIWMMDAGHLKTLVGFESGSMGVGISDDGVTVYYTLEVIPGAGPAATPGKLRGGTSIAGETPVALVPLITMTALADGTIIHVVGYGQTLWSIALAYGVHIDQIRAWNNIAPDSTEIYAGQLLLIRPASLVTPLPIDSTSTPPVIAPVVISQTPPSPHPTVVNTASITPSPTPTVEQVFEPIPPGSASTFENRTLPLIGAASLIIGFTILAFFLLRQKTA